MSGQARPGTTSVVVIVNKIKTLSTDIPINPTLMSLSVSMRMHFRVVWVGSEVRLWVSCWLRDDRVLDVALNKSKSKQTN